ncbi:stem-specific protein TSJT1-like isoform X2 [Hibiscus syriacus]|uniref:stem-specific protein TSJT1-like isoform X2 n=1 Tax=Hibiscus syriacus TaxID=106335 RepID=UPI001923D9A1|nr:stem-specific protein TSJT1-like isoform X2 [Hibiscus syriacus]
MLTIFNKELMNPPKELHSPASLSSSNKPKSPEEIIKDFLASNPTNAFSIGFGSSACFAYAPPENRYSNYQRLFCGVDEIYCIFLGGLNNLNSLLRQYGLSKGNNEAMFIIEAYRTLRDRGPYPADQVLKDLEGSYGFVVYDGKAKSVFAALGSDERVKFHWGVAADGSVVVSDNLKLIKESCSKSFAPFPAGCMFHSEQRVDEFRAPEEQNEGDAEDRQRRGDVWCRFQGRCSVENRYHAESG